VGLDDAVVEAFLAKLEGRSRLLELAKLALQLGPPFEAANLLGRFRLAILVDALLDEPDGAALLQLLGTLVQQGPDGLRGWRHVGRVLTEQEFKAEVARRCASGEQLCWSSFVGLSPLAALPPEDARRHVRDLLGRAREGLGVRELNRNARQLVDQHNEALSERPAGPLEGDDHERLDDDVGALQAEVSNLRRELQELRRGLGQARTGEDEDRDATLPIHTSDDGRLQGPHAAPEGRVEGGAG